ncbi:hypothetical protein FH972_025058 [Carpinus fangiana]|uniref:PABS domain-containing protein n=1 Tax=Carpinus fangiana TaxID=176857 RepID=A0A5N6KZX7_9ROSI|nr:hypothetical protein FH972_025058 [Carpinus fangiana]
MAGRKTPAGSADAAENRQVELDEEDANIRIALSSPFSLVRVVVLVLLLALWSQVIEFNLTPAYGSIPASKWRGLLASTAYNLPFGISVSHSTSSARLVLRYLEWLPLLALGSAWALHAYLYRLGSLLGPTWASVTTKVIVQVPVLLLGALIAVHLCQLRHRFLPIGLMMCTMWLFRSNISMTLLERSLGPIGSHPGLTRYSLLVTLSFGFSIVCPPTRNRKVFLRWAIVAISAGSWFLAFDPHAPFQRALDVANRRLESSGFTILDREESITGYVSVIENTAQGFRTMRCDHSLLGGNWLVTPQSIANGMTRPESIFSIFTMLEAVRLMVPVIVPPPPPPPPHSQTALVIGLGIGTAPTALAAHTINTTVLELDPAVTRLARTHFALPPALTVLTADATSHIPHLAALSPATRPAYDFILHDVFTGGAEPAPLFAPAFLRALHALLAPGGVVAVNYAGDLRRKATWRALRRVARVLGNCRAFRDSAAAPEGRAGPDFANVVVYCARGTGAWGFREAVEGDFLGSLGRREWLVPRHEVALFAGVGEGDEEEGGGEEGGGDREQSAADHWRIMRGVLPDIVWETW